MSYSLKHARRSSLISDSLVIVSTNEAFNSIVGTKFDIRQYCFIMWIVYMRWEYKRISDSTNIVRSTKLPISNQSQMLTKVLFCHVHWLNRTGVLIDSWFDRHCSVESTYYWNQFSETTISHHMRSEYKLV